MSPGLSADALPFIAAFVLKDAFAASLLPNILSIGISSSCTLVFG